MHGCVETPCRLFAWNIKKMCSWFVVLDNRTKWVIIIFCNHKVRVNTINVFIYASEKISSFLFVLSVCLFNLFFLLYFLCFFCSLLICINFYGFFCKTFSKSYIFMKTPVCYDSDKAKHCHSICNPI